MYTNYTPASKHLGASLSSVRCRRLPSDLSVRPPRRQTNGAGKNGRIGGPSLRLPSLPASVGGALSPQQRQNSKLQVMLPVFPDCNHPFDAGRLRNGVEEGAGSEAEGDTEPEEHKPARIT